MLGGLEGAYAEGGGDGAGFWGVTSAQFSCMQDRLSPSGRREGVEIVLYFIWTRTAYSYWQMGLH